MERLFLVSDVMPQKKKTCVFSSRVIPTSMAVHVLDFGRFVSTATATLAIIIAYQRQRRRVMGAVLERQALRDFWKVISQKNSG